MQTDTETLISITVADAPQSVWWLNVIAAVCDGHVTNSLWFRKPQSHFAKGHVVTISRTILLNYPATTITFHYSDVFYTSFCNFCKCLMMQ